MKFDLLSYRFGALATLSRESAGRFELPPKSELMSKFREQQLEIQHSEGLRSARTLIEEVARKRLGDDVVYTPGNNVPPPDEADPRSVRSLPPPFGKRRRRPSSHLAAVLPRDRLTFQLNQGRLALRVRAAVTACALEDSRGFPKLWWVFEAVPAHPENGDQLTLLQAVRLLKFARELESGLLDHLKDAYFQTLSTVTNGEALDGELLDRMHIRCVDAEDEGIAALIDALRFRVESAAELRRAEGQSLKTAKIALKSFDSFITTTNDDCPIDPDSIKPETRLLGIEGVTARRGGPQRGDISIAAIARTQVEPTPYDHLPSVQARRLRELSEDRLWEASPARRLGRELANDAAQELDDFRHAQRQPSSEDVTA